MNAKSTHLLDRLVLGGWPKAQTWLRRSAPRSLALETYVFAKSTPVTSARENHAHPSSSSRDLVAWRLMTRSGVYFARLCTPARIGSNTERKRRGADTKKGTGEQRVFILQTPVSTESEKHINLSGRFGNLFFGTSSRCTRFGAPIWGP